MTNAKKLSDYTVSDIEKILKSLPENIMLNLWNDFYADRLCGCNVLDPYDIDTYLEEVSPSRILNRIGDHFNLSDKYMAVGANWKFITFNTLIDKNSPVDFEQCAYHIVEYEDETTLRYILDNCIEE